MLPVLMLALNALRSKQKQNKSQADAIENEGGMGNSTGGMKTEIEIEPEEGEQKNKLF